MGRDVYDLELPAHEEHGEVPGVGEARQDLRVPRVLHAGRGQPLLVHGRRHHAVDLSRLTEPDGGLDVGIRGPPRFRADLAPGQARRVHVAKVETFERAGLEAGLPRLCHDVQTERGAEQRQRGLHHRAIADDDGATRRRHRRGGQGLGRDLGTHPGGIAHGDADER